MTTIKIEGLTELLLQLKRVEQLERIKAAMRAAAVHLKGKIATYPGPGHRPQPFKTDKQRRGFFAKLKDGQIEVPYRRGASPGSQRLGTRWTIASRNSGLTQVIGNNASYGPLVQGPDKQTSYHATTGWRTTEQVVETERETVVNFLRKAVEDELR